MDLVSGVIFEGVLKNLQVLSKYMLSLLQLCIREPYMGASDGSLLNSDITERVGFAKPQELLFK